MTVISNTKNSWETNKKNYIHYLFYRKVICCKARATTNSTHLSIHDHIQKKAKHKVLDIHILLWDFGHKYLTVIEVNLVSHIYLGYAFFLVPLCLSLSRISLARGNSDQVRSRWTCHCSLSFPNAHSFSIYLNILFKWPPAAKFNS